MKLRKVMLSFVEITFKAIANDNLAELGQLTMEKEKNQHGRWLEASKEKYLNIKGLREASGKNDESLKYFYKNYLSS